jgi:hypothetical protein
MLEAETRRAFESLVAAAVCDGDLGDAERLTLHRKATEWDVPLPLVQEFIDRGHRGQLRVSIPPTNEAREELFNSLIDVACADGRVEAAEYHLLAKFASHLGLALADLRVRVKDRLDTKPLRANRETLKKAERTVKRERERERAPEPARVPPPEPQPPIRPLPQGPLLMPHAEGPAPAPPGPQALDVGHSPGETAPDLPPRPPGPVQLTHSSLIREPIEDVPFVTLQLLKQSIQIEGEADSIRMIERTMGLDRLEAERLRSRILAAYPELKESAPRRR